MNKINVLDVSGNLCHTTYERRAKGLVKKGRANVVDCHTIQLCPQPIQEDNKMEEQLNVQDILTRIDQMQEQASYLKEALMTIEKIPQSISDEQAQERANAARDIVREKETTNRQLLSLLEKMYDDTK